MPFPNLFMLEILVPSMKVHFSHVSYLACNQGLTILLKKNSCIHLWPWLLSTTQSVPTSISKFELLQTLRPSLLCLNYYILIVLAFLLIILYFYVDNHTIPKQCDLPFPLQCLNFFFYLNYCNIVLYTTCDTYLSEVF